MPMIALFRVLRLLALVVWVGGLIFFAFVVAPVAFKILPSSHMAGTVVAGTLKVLNIIGVVCALVLLVCCTVLWLNAARSSLPRRTTRLISAQLWLLLVMLAATACVQWRIVPAMENDRIAAGGDVAVAPADNPARRHFERLHPISEKVEGSALLLGLGVVVLTALEPDQRARTI